MIIIIIIIMVLARAGEFTSLARAEVDTRRRWCVHYIGTIIINICPGDETAAAHGHDRRPESRRVNITTARASDIK